MITLDEKNIGDNALKNYNENTTKSIVNIFIERYDLAIRYIIHIGRKLYTNSISYYSIHIGYDYSLIGNMDETLTFFNIVTNSMVNIEAKKLFK